ncbi:sigma 54-interacting transcriptional regulator [Thermoanaerobacterium thermosaccharolyticum]|uniref:sigma 54-interacting transcriptional regulator n=1 Tax=Thermoanaerobacterium thermosaccharolyticum TaxID=1517 RepID=UPI00177B134C|nr:sigma-54-dependent transcriptional regulator [Thermoanaerobacterium thermosaccharolyticum]MBE0068814.1 PRD domain-containing protein [Thermoanaerobacterium thermosaccharolyticum]MBE0227147.1 PRD domain-containing protein [Thermoanaerobacterium thermosaccharolyticum]
MKRIDKVYEKLRDICLKQLKNDGEISGCSAIDLAKELSIHRSNASSDLNKLFKDGKVSKIEGKPVLYCIKSDELNKNINPIETDAFSRVIGSNLSLKNAVQQAKAAIMYPPHGLHTLILGETGTGKSMFAETMYEYAKEIGRLKTNAPFITFNCADYANNPQLLMAQLFGVKKGAYTGADRDKVGIVEKADKGILFLDEVHRLPPEGQEMLFYLIDKGMFRRLGETDIQHKVDVLIICATTENVESILLKTFTRRIPMVINLPSLKERTYEERYEIIKNFMIDEASVIKNDIFITSNALKAFLLYDCPNNIGQLKSDIKLCAAKAYLGFMMNRDKEVVIHTEDLPQYIKRGLFKYKEEKDKIDKFIKDDKIRFSTDKNDIISSEGSKAFNFYEALEEKRRSLEEKGISENDIKLIMSLDIETYLKRYINEAKRYNLEELYKVVDKRIVDIVDNFLNHARKILKRDFSEKTLYGLSMHVASSIERILSGKKIENHQLDDIKRIYKDEFEVSKELKKLIEREFDIEVPEGEVGFITMFLCLDIKQEKDDEKVSVIVAMHGESTATSIADVSNRLLGENFVVGYNMPLDQKPEIALNNLCDLIKKTNKGKGVLLLVDMGSLAFFGDMVYEKTGIPVKTVEMASTPMVLEAGRKALLNASLDEVYDSALNLSPYIGRIYKDNFEMQNGFKNDVIITACITGEGTALKLKSILEKKLDLKSAGIDIITLNIEDKREFKRKLQNIKTEKNILAVVSAFDPGDDTLKYISTTDVFDNRKLSSLKAMIDSRDALDTINNMKEIIAENVDIDADKYINAFKEFYLNIAKNKVSLDNDKIIGLILHLACAIERVLKGGELIRIKNCKSIIEKNTSKYEMIKTAVKPVNEAFNVTLSDDEYVSIMMIVFSL